MGEQKKAKKKKKPEINDEVIFALEYTLLKPEEEKPKEEKE